MQKQIVLVLLLCILKEYQAGVIYDAAFLQEKGVDEIADAAKVDEVKIKLEECKTQIDDLMENRNMQEENSVEHELLDKINEAKERSEGLSSQCKELLVYELDKVESEGAKETSKCQLKAQKDDMKIKRELTRAQMMCVSAYFRISSNLPVTIKDIMKMEKELLKNEKKMQKYIVKSSNLVTKAKNCLDEVLMEADEDIATAKSKAEFCNSNPQLHGIVSAETDEDHSIESDEILGETGNNANIDNNGNEQTGNTDIKEESTNGNEVSHTENEGANNANNESSNAGNNAEIENVATDNGSEAGTGVDLENTAAQEEDNLPIESANTGDGGNVDVNDIGSQHQENSGSENGNLDQNNAGSQNQIIETSNTGSSTDTNNNNNGGGNILSINNGDNQNIVTDNDKVQGTELDQANGGSVVPETGNNQDTANLPEESVNKYPSPNSADQGNEEGAINNEQTQSESSVNQAESEPANNPNSNQGAGQNQANGNEENVPNETGKNEDPTNLPVDSGNTILQQNSENQQNEEAASNNEQMPSESDTTADTQNSMNNGDVTQDNNAGNKEATGGSENVVEGTAEENGNLPEGDVATEIQNEPVNVGNGNNSDNANEGGINEGTNSEIGEPISAANTEESNTNPEVMALEGENLQVVTSNSEQGQNKGAENEGNVPVAPQENVDAENVTPAEETIQQENDEGIQTNGNEQIQENNLNGQPQEVSNANVEASSAGETQQGDANAPVNIEEVSASDKSNQVATEEPASNNVNNENVETQENGNPSTIDNNEAIKEEEPVNENEPTVHNVNNESNAEPQENTDSITADNNETVIEEKPAGQNESEIISANNENRVDPVENTVAVTVDNNDTVNEEAPINQNAEAQPLDKQEETANNETIAVEEVQQQSLQEKEVEVVEEQNTEHVEISNDETPKNQ